MRFCTQPCVWDSVQRIASSRLLIGYCSIWLVLRYMLLRRNDLYCYGSIKLTKKMVNILGTQRGAGEQERSLCMIKTTGLGGVVSDGWVGDRLVMDGLGIG